ncbi:MAG: Wzz/FepE/Etk N-terminal domain-containing protein [Trueperaceae bacterium]
MSETYDEISLRDLYLIIKRGFPLILVVAVLAAAGALLFVTLRTQRYQAETTVLINPTPVRVQGTRNLALEQGNSVSWETYQTIAFSRSVIEDALSRLEPGTATVDMLRGSGELTRLAGPQNASQIAPLTISHAFTHADPVVAAATADAWASATVETVSAGLLASLESVRTATAQQLESLEQQLSSLEERWTEFQSRDESELVGSRLTGLAERVPFNEAILEEAERAIATAQGEREALAAVETRSAGNVADPGTAAALLEDREGLPPDTLSTLTALLGESGAGNSDLVSLVREVELQRLTAEQAGLIAMRDATEIQLEELREQAQVLRERQAGMVLERDRLRRQLEVANSAHADLAELEPIIEYIYELAPTNSRILSNASLPSDSVGPRGLLVAVLAGLVGGMLALLYVFLRAAVSEPDEQLAREPVQATPAH